MTRNTTAVAAIILAVAALGVGGFLIYGVYFQPAPEQSKVVGVWENLARNMAYAPYNVTDDFLIAVSSAKLQNAGYLSLADSGTKITLLKAGWYRVNLKVYLSGIGASATYLTRLLVDGDIVEFFDRHITSASPESAEHMIDAEVTVYISGTSAIAINAICTAGDTDFSIFGNQYYHQVAIDYLAA